MLSRSSDDLSFFGLRREESSSWSVSPRYKSFISLEDSLPTSDEGFELFFVFNHESTYKK